VYPLKVADHTTDELVRHLLDLCAQTADHETKVLSLRVLLELTWPSDPCAQKAFQCSRGLSSSIAPPLTFRTGFLFEAGDIASPFKGEYANILLSKHSGLLVRTSLPIRLHKTALSVLFDTILLTPEGTSHVALGLCLELLNAYFLSGGAEYSLGAVAMLLYLERICYAGDDEDGDIFYESRARQPSSSTHANASFGTEVRKRADGFIRRFLFMSATTFRSVALESLIVKNGADAGGASLSLKRGIGNNKLRTVLRPEHFFGERILECELFGNCDRSCVYQFRPSICKLNVDADTSNENVAHAHVFSSPLEVSSVLTKCPSEVDDFLMLSGPLFPKYYTMNCPWRCITPTIGGTLAGPSVGSTLESCSTQRSSFLDNVKRVLTSTISRRHEMEFASRPQMMTVEQYR